MPMHWHGLRKSFSNKLATKRPTTIGIITYLIYYHISTGDDRILQDFQVIGDKSYDLTGPKGQRFDLGRMGPYPSENFRDFQSRLPGANWVVVQESHPVTFYWKKMVGYTGVIMFTACNCYNLYNLCNP